MNQQEQKAVGLIDPHAHTTSGSNSNSNSNSNTTATPLRVATDNTHGSNYQTAGPTIDETHLQNKSPLDSSSSPATTTTTTTATTATTSGRKLSLTDTLIARAATAATTASHAATSAVAAARRLVGEHSSEIDLGDNEASDTVQAGKASSPKRGLFGFIKSSTTSGLEFSQRRLSTDKTRRKSSSHPVSSAPTVATASVPASASVSSAPTSAVPVSSLPASVSTAVPNAVPAPLPTSAAPVPVPASIPTSAPAAVSTSIPTAMSVSVQPSVPVSVPATISFAEKPVMPTTTNNNRVTTNTTATNSGTPGATNPITRKGSISEIIGQTVILTEPHNTLYVTHQGGARNQALGVDQPTISSTSHTTKSQTQSGLGVDKPIYVGIHEDPKTQIRRRGTLHVDKTPVFVDDALLSDPNNRDQDSYTANIVENNNTNPKLLAGAPANDTFSRRRRWSFSALNVDSPSVPTANIAGSGSTDKTNRSRPVGIYNSGYNVDRAGHHDQKTSGLHVDQPAVTTHQMAAVPKPQQSQSQQQQQQPFSSTTTTTTFNTRSHSPTFNKLHNPTNSAVNPYATTTTITQTQLTPAEMGPTINYQPTSNNSSSSSAADAAAGATNNNSMVIPADYHGPIPQVAPGEQVIWVKKTVVKTDYYEGDHGNAAGPTPPAPVQESAAQSRRSSTGSILDRLRGRRASVDKGKQRVDS